jgi:uncharacterized protein (DUF433 family)
MPRSVPLGVRLAHQFYEAATELARRTRRSVGSIVGELVEDVLRMRRLPGIVFAGPPGDRRARVEGSGLDVWEVVAVWRACGESTDRTLEVLQHLTPRQVEAALRYYRACPEEIEALIRENERPPEERIQRYPSVGRPSGLTGLRIPAAPDAPLAG